MVDSGIPLDDILKWDLEDLDKANAILDIKRDHDMVLRIKKIKEDER